MTRRAPARAPSRSSTSSWAGARRSPSATRSSTPPAGTMVLVEVGTRRSAVAAEPDTTVLVVGGRPGAALPASPFEHYYAAQPAYDAGDYDRAVAIAGEGLEDWPDHPLIHYQLACFHARAGRLDDARRSLDIAFAGDERTREWAARGRRFGGAAGACRSSARRLRRRAARTASSRGGCPDARSGPRGAEVLRSSRAFSNTSSGGRGGVRVERSTWRSERATLHRAYRTRTARARRPPRTPSPR